MAKKLISLILVLPLILMVCLYTAANFVSLKTPVAVNSIEIIGDTVYLDLDKNEKYSVDYAIYPINAKNKEIVFTTEPVGNSPFAELEYVDGKIVAKSCGKAKVYLTTVDGGFRDSFIVQVNSARLQSLDSRLESTSIYVGDTTRIINTFIPEEPTNPVNAPPIVLQNKSLRFSLV